jgi:hypothetical protein
LRVRGLKGQGPLGAVKTLALAARAVVECRREIAAFGADLLLGTGGYSSGPAAVAARTLGIPVVLQEQNTVPGLTNRLLARIAWRVFIAFEPARRYSPGCPSGNPVRDEARAGAEAGRGQACDCWCSAGARATVNRWCGALPSRGGRLRSLRHQRRPRARSWPLSGAGPERRSAPSSTRWARWCSGRR